MMVMALQFVALLELAVFSGLQDENHAHEKCTLTSRNDKEESCIFKNTVIILR